MGAGAGAAAAIENEPSPRRAAIEKAQAELRREVAVREERRRELEFLEKGGELLDFFSAPNTTLPLPFPTDLLADQLVLSRAEGGLISIPLANGDSLENSVGTNSFVGRGSEGGDHRFGDDGASTTTESIALPWEGKGRALRTGSTSLRPQSDVNLKRECESSGGGRIGGKGQAYSRRNRARSNRFGNGYTSTREVEKAVEISSTPPVELKGHPVPVVVHEEASKANENMVEKNVKPLLVHLALPDTSGNWGGLGSTKLNYHVDDPTISHVKVPDQHCAKHAPVADDSVELRNIPLSSGPVVAGATTLLKTSDVKDGVCTGFNVKDDLPLVANLNKLEDLPSIPCLEENLVVKEGCVVPQPLEQLQCSSQSIDKEDAVSNLVPDEIGNIMRREKILITGHLGQLAAKGDCRNKLSALGSDSQAEKDGDRATTLLSDHVPCSSLVPKIDPEKFVQLEVTGILQVPSMSLDSSENRSNATRKLSSTAGIDVQNLSKSEKAIVNEELLHSARVEVKIEEGFPDVVLRLNKGSTGAESGDDAKRICVLPLQREEIKTEGQSTPVSSGSNRASFRTPGSFTVTSKFPGVVLPWEKEKDPNVIAEAERHKAELSAKAKKAHEDYILEEAEIIKAGKKEIAEWGKRKPQPAPVRQKSHWDFVLEEMAWMANDFMQERLWKMASASQFCRWIAQLKGQCEFQAKDVKQRQKKVARILANAVNDFWRSLELSIYKEKGSAFSSVNSQVMEVSVNVKDGGEAVPMDVDTPAVAEAYGKQLGNQEKKLSKWSLPVQGYAKCFLRKSLGIDLGVQAEAPSTPERTSEASSILDSLWEEQFPEEPLFYTVPNGALSAYRYSVETQRALLEAEHEQTWQEHATALADAEAQAVTETETTSDFLLSHVDEGQSLTCLSSPTKGLCVVEDGAQYGLSHSIIAKKKRKNVLKSNMPKVEGLLPSSGPSHPLAFLGFDNGGRLPSPLVTGKRSLPAGSTTTSAIVGGIPTKRMRSGTNRQRPLGTSSPSSFPSPATFLNRTTFSSGALNSNHEEVHNMADSAITSRAEVDAADTVGKNVLGAKSNSPSINSKSKKKKKTKHFSGALGSSFKADGSASGNTGSALKPVESEHHSVYDQLKRKGDQLHAGSNDAVGGIGTSAETPEPLASQGQQPLKKAKLSKQVPDMAPETAGGASAVIVPAVQSGSMVANASNASKLLRQNSNRDRNRKGRSNKVFVSQPAGIGIPWSTIEDQAILALVHDLGPNWELVSDVLSSSSQLKGIFRRPKQCKERHKALMDRLSVGEGGESPDEPSTSQPHPSTLPGIPKGSARVLLQRLQGPMEEDTLKVHLEHIVRVVQKFHALKPQNEEQKSLVPPHPSHMNAVSQFCNSGLTGGFPTPLELCDLSAANPELGGPSYQMAGPHLPSVLPSGSGMRPTTNGMPVIPGVSNLHMGVPAMAPSNAAVNAARDVHRLAAMRPFSPEEAQRVRYARAMAAAARGLPVPGAPVTAGLPMMALSSPNDCNVPMLAAGNSVGMIGGLSRSMSLSRASLPGIGSPGVSSIGSPTLGNMLPPGGVSMVGAASSVGSAGAPSQVNLMRRPRDQMVRSGRTNEEQRQIFIQELQHQAAQGNTEAQTALTTLNRDLSNPLISAQTQNFTSQQHQTQQQQYIAAARMVKERHQLQQQQHKQRLLQHQLQQPTSLPLPLQQQQLHPMPQQQHAPPQQSQMPQHQHLLPQQHAMQKQQSQQGPQQSGLPLPSSSVQPMAPLIPSNHPNQSLPQPQSHSPQQSQSSGQAPQISVQSKLQQPKQSQKHQLQQQSSQQQQQQQQSRGSKGVVRGSMMMQALPIQPGLPNMLPGNVALGNQLVQQLPGQSMSHSLSGQRSVQPQGPLAMGKPQGLTCQPGQQSQTATGPSIQGSVGQQQQKVLQQTSQIPLLPKQRQASPPLHQSHTQQPPSTPGLPTQQQQLSPQAQQSQFAQQQSQAQSRRQPQQQAQLQSAGQRRPQQRQQGSNTGVSVASQAVKTGNAQQGQISPQISPQTGHLTYPLGTNIAGSISMVGTSSGTSVVAQFGSSSTSGVRSTQWKPGQNASSMSTGMYNLTRIGNTGTVQVPTLNSSGVHMMSESSSSALDVSIGGLPQSHQSLQVGSGVHEQNAGSGPLANSRAMTAAQLAGAQRPSQQHHGNLSMPLAMGAGQVKAPGSASSGGMLPVSTLGTSTVAAGALAFQGSSASAPGSSSPVANSMPMFAVQPRQPNPATAALNTSSPSANLGASASSPAANSTSSDPTTST